MSNGGGAEAAVAAPAAAAPPLSQKRLYVGNLAFATTDENLRALFEQAGTLVSAEVIKTYGGRSRGFGVVEYETDEAAAAAIEKFNESECEGRKILVRIDQPKRPAPNRGGDAEEAEPSPKIFVGNLPFTTTTEELKELFDPKGTIVEAQVATDRRSGRSRGYGTVEYSSVEEAKAAIEALDQEKVQGRSIHVRYDRRFRKK